MVNGRPNWCAGWWWNWSNKLKEIMYRKRTLKTNYDNALEGEDATEEKNLLEKMYSLFFPPETRRELSGLSKKDQLKTIEGLLAKQDKNDLDSMEDYRGDYDRTMEAQEDDIDSQYTSYNGLLGEDSGDDSVEEIPEELSYDTGDQWVKDHMVDQSYNKVNSNAMDAKENYASNQFGSTSGGMTNSALGAKSGMSPMQKQAMVGLLKDFMTPAQDDPAPQVRGAGIIKGGGTPFPSLLQQRPQRKYYENKGLV